MATIPHSDSFLAEFKAQPNWLVWREVPNRNGKPTKVPYSARGGAGSSTDPATWSTFEEAAAVVERFDGLGFALAGNKVLIDLDGCRDATTGAIEEWARFIVEFLQCPAEVSPSGKGLHVYLKARNARSVKHLWRTGEHKQGVEVYYGAGRYTTVSFNHLPGTPLVLPEVDLVQFLTFLERGDFDPADVKAAADSKPAAPKSPASYRPPQRAPGPRAVGDRQQRGSAQA